MAAGKIKITVDNLEDAQGVITDEDATLDTSKKDKKIAVASKSRKESAEVDPPKKKKRGRPPKKKPVKKETKKIFIEEESARSSVGAADESRKNGSARSSVGAADESLARDSKEKIDFVGDFMNKINVSARQKQEVMDEIEKKSLNNEKEDIKEETNAKDELKFSSLAKNDFEEDEAEKTMQTNGDEPEEVQTKRSIGLYRKIAIFFLVATVFLLAFVFYFLFASVTVTIIPDQERINNSMIIDVYDKDSDNIVNSDKIAGVVKKISMDLSDSYKTTGEDVIGEEVAGEVTIYNYYIKSQPLVATTRLMAPNGNIYRIEDTVNVPAGGQVKVRVYADDPSVNMEIGPTKFTIPGLWAGIQDKIYGESTDKIEYSQKVNKFVNQTDIDNAIRDLKQQLVQKAKVEINKKYEDYSQIIYSIDDNSVFTQIEAERGDKIDEFDASITANIVAVAFDGEAAANLAEKKFTSTLPAEKELIEFNRNNIIYTLDSFDYNEGTASINSTFEGKVSLDSNSDVINKEEILGLNKDQLDAYLINKEGISGYDIKFFPSFIKKVPAIPDKIIIKTKR